MRAPRRSIFEQSNLLPIMLLVVALMGAFFISWFKRFRFFFFFGMFLTLGAVWLGLNGCTPNDLGTTPPTDDSTGYASLRVTNYKEQDPGPLTFRLFDSNAVNAQSAVKIRDLGVVAESATVTFNVPAGSYKLAFDDNSRVWPMTDKDSTELTWPQAKFVKGATYHVTIHSEDTRTVWDYDVPVDP